MCDSLIDIAIHKKVDLKYRNEIISIGDLYLPNKSGLIEKITPLEKLLEMDGVIDGEMFVKTGDYQEKRRVGNDASGWVQVSGKNEFDTLRKMQAVYDAIGEQGMVYASFEHSFWIRHKGQLIRVM